MVTKTSKIKTMRTKRKSILRWAGSKRGSLPDLLECTPFGYTTYVEPFAGSAVVFFALDAEKSRLSDLNWPLVNFFQWLKHDPEGLHQRSTQWRRDKETYLKIRSGFDTESDTLESAASFFYLNANCFNGIYRTNRKNKFNVPFAGSRMAKTPSYEEFFHFSSRLQRAEFDCCDFRKALTRETTPHHFFYIDPPYFVDDRRVFREYGPEYFSRGDLEELACILTDLDRAGAKFLLSYADCELARKLFGPWEIGHLSLTRNVGGFKSNRKREKELIVTNYETAIANVH